MTSHDLRDTAGFTLIEVLIAFVILAVSFGALFSTYSAGLEIARDVEARSAALSISQSLLEGAGPEDGEQQGDISSRSPCDFHWRQAVKQVDYSGGRGDLSVRSQQVSVEVSWRAGSRDRSVSLSTLRLSPLRATP
jgi:general secretion pathway protein I